MSYDLLSIYADDEYTTVNVPELKDTPFTVIVLRGDDDEHDSYALRVQPGTTISTNVLEDRYGQVNLETAIKTARRLLNNFDSEKFKVAMLNCISMQTAITYHVERTVRYDYKDRAWPGAMLLTTTLPVRILKAIFDGETPSPIDQEQARNLFHAVADFCEANVGYDVVERTI